MNVFLNITTSVYSHVGMNEGFGISRETANLISLTHKEVVYLWNTFK